MAYQSENIDDDELWEVAQSGDPEAKEKLILRYVPLAKFWARKIKKTLRGRALEDLENIGVEALVRVVNSGTYDPQKSTFRTYASVSIRRAIWNDPEVSPMSRRHGENSRHVMKAHDKLRAKLGRKPTLQEIAQELDLSVEEVERRLQDLTMAVAIGSAESLSEVDENALPEFNGHGSNPDELASRMDVERALQTLDPRAHRIIVLYYWKGLSYREIARELDLKTDNVKQIAKRGRDNLRPRL
ncbi:sigma-70 family RNA polymerase sigma factor [Chloroflexi bacterium TSY]|nr:sigma-70 family RNA polymerase sigma factor [Chloroflexi bacterium TSY]